MVTTAHPDEEEIFVTLTVERRAWDDKSQSMRMIRTVTVEASRGILPVCFHLGKGTRPCANLTDALEAMIAPLGPQICRHLQLCDVKPAVARAVPKPDPTGEPA